jgi:hypothetical protein
VALSAPSIIVGRAALQLVGRARPQKTPVPGMLREIDRVAD